MLNAIDNTATAATNRVTSPRTSSSPAIVSTSSTTSSNDTAERLTKQLASERNQFESEKIALIQAVAEERKRADDIIRDYAVRREQLESSYKGVGDDVVCYVITLGGRCQRVATR
jgi:hypothetical protein